MPLLSQSNGRIASKRRLFGVYTFEAATSPQSIKNVEKVLDRDIDIVSIYQAWDPDLTAVNPKTLSRLAANGWTPLITWEPWSIRCSGRQPWDQPRYSLERILSGQFDALIQRFAEIVAALPGPVWLRPMHEMNGDWYPWCGSVNGNTPALYIKAWRYLHDALANVGATWVWSPYTRSHPGVSGNEMFDYYPGDAYVDWLAVDGYNWGGGQEGNGWETFDELFGDTYAKFLSSCGKPIMIAETACAETGGDKALWIADMFSTLAANYKQVRALIWFDTLKERDWRLASSPAGLNAFKRGLRCFR